MPRDVALWTEGEAAEPALSDAHTSGASVEATATACYVCGAWSDDPSRCRSPESTACPQHSCVPSSSSRVA